MTVTLDDIVAARGRIAGGIYELLATNPFRFRNSAARRSSASWNRNSAPEALRSVARATR